MICRGGDTPDFGHAFSNYTYSQTCGRIWLSSVQRVPRVADEKKEKEEEEYVVKYKSADNYVGRITDSTTCRTLALCLTHFGQVVRQFASPTPSPAVRVLDSRLHMWSWYWCVYTRR